jgi:4-amino-4-deoxy-L-arabinose transferase-like glycosyltransferase
MNHMRKDLACLSALTLLCCVLFGFQLGKTGLLDPDEPFYSLTAREMLEKKDPWTPTLFGQPQFEKPAFFYWVLYASFKWLGVSEFSARLGPAVAGTLTVLVVFLWGRTLFRRREPALLAAVMLASAGQFIVLSRIVLTDVFLCLFVTSALASFSWGLRNEKLRPLAWNLFFLFSALGFLTKGPLGLFIPLSGIAAYSFYSRERWMLAKLPWLTGLPLFAAVGFPWYAFMAKTHGAWFLEHFFLHENVRRFFVAEHRGMDRWHFYPFVLMFGFFPWSSFVFEGLADGFKKRGARFFLVLGFTVPSAFFILAKSKLMSYIFPVYPAAALLAGAWAWKLVRMTRLGAAVPARFLAGSALVWGIFPVLLSLAIYTYAERAEIPITAPVAAIASFLIPMSWCSLYFLFKRRASLAISTMLVMTAMFSCAAFGWMMPKAGSAYSSKRWARDWQRVTESHPGSMFLASKMFVRGMTFYTRADGLGVFSTNPDGGFYTPHPIRIISDTKEFQKMPKKEFPVYFLIRGKELKHLMNGLPKDMSVHVMKAASQRILVRLDHA